MNKPKGIGNSNVDDITQDIGIMILGNLVGLLGKGAGMLFSAIGSNNPVALSGSERMLDDAQANQSPLLEFYMQEKLSSDFYSNFNYREEVRSYFNDKVRVDKNRYIDR